MGWRLTSRAGLPDEMMAFFAARMKRRATPNLIYEMRLIIFFFYFIGRTSA
jgi:hypothetical protein